MDKGMAVTVRGITKCFQGKEVIHKSDMSVPYGSIYGFLGENGAGKTTIFKILLGLLKSTCGTAGSSIFYGNAAASGYCKSDYTQSGTSDFG